MDEIGAVFHVRRDVAVRAVQLTDTADWAAIAKWCGGMLIDAVENRELALRLSGDTGTSGWWVVRGVTGYFFLRSPVQFELDYCAVTA